MVALTLGFRERDGIITQNQSLAPLGWENLNEVPDLADTEDDIMARKVLSDIPENEESTGAAIGHLTTSLFSPI